MTTSAISLGDVTASSLRLMNDDVLVRPAPMEEVRASGLFVPNTPTQHWLGDVFYGTVVAVGPGRLVSRERVPLPVKVGDTVVCRQGFGPEILLREGRHHLVGRGNSDYGHGILASWDPGHVHCWHMEGQLCYAHSQGGARWNDACADSQGLPVNGCRVMAECSCGSRRQVKTRLPSCASCPPGERLAEAVLGGEVSRVPIPDARGAGDYEERPVDDGRHAL